MGQPAGRTRRPACVSVVVFWEGGGRAHRSTVAVITPPAARSTVPPPRGQQWTQEAVLALKGEGGHDEPNPADTSWGRDGACGAVLNDITLLACAFPHYISQDAPGTPPPPFLDYISQDAPGTPPLSWTTSPRMHLALPPPPFLDYISQGAETPYSTPRTPPTSAWTPALPKQRAPSRENQNQRAVPLIHLEMESLRQWKVVRAHAFSLDGDTAAAREPGLYHLYAQVTFSDLPSRPSPLAATLLRRAARGRDWRPVCRALGWAGGRRTLSLAKLERLSGGDRLRLDIAPDNATSLLFNGHATFFGAFKVSD
ncbi:uncharacterized protein [Lepisosteus oculatus]|uniref:uncharacterized protein n=1 Tax=Lepisosteus oculatus TaxID=7918 RepID=UPI0035F50860